MPTIKHQNIVEEVRLICTDLHNNNNKFWHGTIVQNAAGNYETMVDFGRVGYEGAGKPVASGSLESCQKVLNKRAEAKRKGKKKDGKPVSVYTDQRVIGGTGSASASAGKQIKSDALKTAAIKEIAGLDKEVGSLVTYLFKANVHNIKTATTNMGLNLNYDDTTGLFSTPLGVVTQDAITDARILLDEMSNAICNAKFNSKALGNSFNDYMRLIPTKVPLGRKSAEQFIQSVLPNASALQQQNSLLDSLEASIQTLASRPKTKSTGKKVVEEKVFDVSLEPADHKIVVKISKRYLDSSMGQHQCRHLKVKKVYRIRIGTMDSNFKNDGAKLDNIWQLWHGTRVSNLLSILHGGFIIPPSHAKQCTGRMFGDGIYGSDISTKALNYAYGYWGGGGTDSNCFMFLMDFAMGKFYTPGGYGNRSYPHSGHDSTYAKSGKSGVQNNEMIVYRTSQCNPRYLIQFG